MQQPPDHDERNARYGLHFHYGHSHRPFTAVVDTDGAVLAAGWTAQPEGLLPLIAPGLRPASVVHRTNLGAVTTAVVTYHRGDLTAIYDVPVRQRGGEILEHAWQVLRAVPARALFVPCHRVLRSDGSLGGFRWGLSAKRWLLTHESS